MNEMVLFFLWQLLQYSFLLPKVSTLPFYSYRCKVSFAKRYSIIGTFVSSRRSSSFKSSCGGEVNTNNNAKAYAYNIKTISHIYFHNVLILLNSNIFFSKLFSYKHSYETFAAYDNGERLQCRKYKCNFLCSKDNG